MTSAGLVRQQQGLQLGGQLFCWQMRLVLVLLGWRVRPELLLLLLQAVDSIRDSSSSSSQDRALSIWIVALSIWTVARLLLLVLLRSKATTYCRRHRRCRHHREQGQQGAQVLLMLLLLAALLRCVHVCSSCSSSWLVAAGRSTLHWV
jgi:hypothetical protein